MGYGPGSCLLPHCYTDFTPSTALFMTDTSVNKLILWHNGSMTGLFDSLFFGVFLYPTWILKGTTAAGDLLPSTMSHWPGNWEFPWWQLEKSCGKARNSVLWRILKIWNLPQFQIRMNSPPSPRRAKSSMGKNGNENKNQLHFHRTAVPNGKIISKFFQLPINRKEKNYSCSAIKQCFTSLKTLAISHEN